MLEGQPPPGRAGASKPIDALYRYQRAVFEAVPFAHASARFVEGTRIGFIESVC